MLWAALLAGIAGYVDAICYLRLGGAFDDNMTGNIVEDGLASLNPERSIKRRPIAAACIAAALGATLGSKSYQASIFSVALFGAAIALFVKEEDAKE